MKKQVTGDEKGNLVQILNFLNVSVILNSKNEISTDVHYKDTNTHDYLPCGSVHPESCEKNVPYNLAKRIILFVTDPEKVELRLNKLRIWLKSNKYPDHIISNAFYNTKLLGPAPKPKNNFKNIHFVASFHKDTDNTLSQRQPKNVLRLLSNSSISRNPSLPKGIFKCNDKRCKICRLYIRMFRV